MENEDVIRRQMEETRSSLTEKVEKLEQKLVDTVTETTEAVTETVSNVKETVEESVQTVKDWFDIRGHVEDHPWAMLGGSMAAGFVVGAMLPSTHTATEVASGMASASAAPMPASVPSGRKLHHNGGTQPSASSRRPQAQSMVAQSMVAPVTSWLSQFEPELNRLKHLALGAALGTIREMISSGLPQEMAHQVRDVIDDVTKKIGGEPLPSSDLANMASVVKSFVQGGQQDGSQGTGHPGDMGNPQGENPGTAPTEHQKRFSMQ